MAQLDLPIQSHTPSKPLPSTINPECLQMATPPPESPVKKTGKRKWGAPIGDIPKIIAPRKRAKTEEEKHQRKLERTARNRDAAEKSRERNKEQAQRITKQRDYLQELVQTFINEWDKAAATNPDLPPMPQWDMHAVMIKIEDTLKTPSQLKKQKQQAAAATAGSDTQTQPESDAQTHTDYNDTNQSSNPSPTNSPLLFGSPPITPPDEPLPLVGGDEMQQAIFEKPTSSVAEAESGGFPARNIIVRLHARLFSTPRSMEMFNLALKLVKDITRTMR